jgi:hypothetical protein
MTLGLGGSSGGATRIGLTDVIVIAIVMMILLFAAWKQFPAYNRPFTPRPLITRGPLRSAPGAIRTPASRSASQR